MSRRKIGRNDPCHCGSGEKYKKCHGNGVDKTASAARPADMPVAATGARRQWLSEQVLRDPRFRFFYYVPHPDQDLRDATPLQFYTPGILDTVHLFQCITQWPGDIRELAATPASILLFRVMGMLDRRVAPIQFSTFEDLVRAPTPPFICAVSNEQTCEFVSRALGNAKAHWLHISTKKADRATFIGDLTPEKFRDYAREALARYGQEPANRLFADFAADVLADDVYSLTKTIDQTVFSHGITLPNEIALHSFRFRFARARRLEPRDPAAFVQASIESAHTVAGTRQELLSRRRAFPRNRMAIVVVSPTWVSRSQDLDPEKLPTADDRKALAAFWRAILRQEVHFLRVEADDVRTSFEKLHDSPIFTAMMSMRAREAAALTVALGTFAAHDLTPVFRLEPRINKIRGELANIGGCARGAGPHREFKLRKLIARLQTQMISLIHERYLGVLSAKSEQIQGVRLVGDLPLELLPIRKLALGLHFDCSRIPLNPGNVSFGELLLNHAIQIPQTHFRELLVVRSFASTDPVRRTLEHAVRLFSERADDPPKIHFVDVETPDEFVRAVNEFAGAIMIFDGHGTRHPEHHTGSIVVGGQAMDLWEHRTSLHLPPIVILSACDTLPIDGSHGSSTTAFLAAGAMTVLGTLLPISAHRAAHFIGRLVFRIAEFLPAALRGTSGPIEWRGFLSGLLRMAHVSELLHEAEELWSLSESLMREIQIEANVLINSRDPQWHAAVARRIKAILPKSARVDSRFNSPLSGLTEAMKYVQVGRPELIQIVRDVSEEGIPSETAPVSN